MSAAAARAMIDSSSVRMTRTATRPSSGAIDGAGQIAALFQGNAEELQPFADATADFG